MEAEISSFSPRPCQKRNISTASFSFEAFVVMQNEVNKKKKNNISLGSVH